MGANKLVITQTDTRSYTATFTENDVAIDITGSTVTFTVKNLPGDTTALITKDITSHTDPTNGITTIALTATDTDIADGQFIYEIRLKETSDRITTFFNDVFLVNEKVET